MFANIITTIGFATMIGAFVYIGRKLQILDSLVIANDKIKTNLKVVSDFLIKDRENFNHTELQAYSPIRLTPDGDKFIESIGFVSAFAAHKADFFAFIDSESPRVKYDVESAAVKSIYSLYEKEYMNFLKAYFYNNPARNLPNTAQTLGVYVRDQYLAEHPEIKE